MDLTNPFILIANIYNSLKSILHCLYCFSEVLKLDLLALNTGNRNLLIYKKSSLTEHCADRFSFPLMKILVTKRSFVRNTRQEGVIFSYLFYTRNGLTQRQVVTTGHDGLFRYLYLGYY